MVRDAASPSSVAVVRAPTTQTLAKHARQKHEVVVAVVLMANDER
jgi:hypothetical protein